MSTQTPDLPVETMDLQMGPSHPATHGTIKFNLKLEGEKVLDCEVEVGYLHRGFDKMCEQATWNQVIPYTDRLNYVSPLINNFGYALAVENLLGVETPPRCQFIRVAMSELSRIMDHLTCLGMAASELGAITAGFYMIEARELLMRIIEAVTGARLTISYARIGGVKHDLPPDFSDWVADAFRKTRRLLADCERLLSRNRIFIDRMSGIGVVSREMAVAYGLTGPILRSTGVNYDVRKAQPYLVYDQMDFEVPLGTKGDNYDRFICRILEIEQSMRIVEQALEKMPLGPIALDDPKIVLPEKEKVYNSIEGLMNHFKFIMEGIQVPAGEVYFAVEGGNGELGFYIVSQGGGRPYRVRVRPPCFIAMSAFHEMIRGHMIADIIPTFGMINMIGGECDR
ncbi:MAG: NADH dehydrogenase (quinone) subunit D [Deltaproteobacteria bacterium RIFCSPLOWO2_12_FULL_60_19]|nr:MAG: NADH dehydrogenase (quinone) subunit D [Deltaproteobacteria bacterium RIFCSPLOWO2_12_FULL_60_19]